MLQRRASRWTFFLLGLALMSASPTNAQNGPRARVVGFPVSLADGKSRLDQTATAWLHDRVSVRVEAWPSCSGEQTTTSAPQSHGARSQPTSAAGNQTASQAGDQNNDLPYDDQQSWIPGLTHAQVLKLVPYLNARPLKGVYPESVDPESHTLTFHLERTDASKEAWTDLLSNPGFKPRVMTFSVGLEDTQQFPTCVTTYLEVIPKTRFLLAIALFLILLYVFFRLAAGTALLRDPGISQGDMRGFSVLWRRQSPDSKLGPFSLARTQMAFWFFMVIAAFVLIWMITGDTNTITEGVLVLIGISAGTALGATAIDSGKRNTTTTEPQPGEESKGFLDDILRDGTGISFHRFQIVVWTIVLGFVFSRSVMSHLAMPDFGTTLLTLMGISSGTYLGMKLPEPEAPESPPTGQPQNPAGGQASTQDQQGQQNNDQTNKVQQDAGSGDQAAQG